MLVNWFSFCSPTNQATDSENVWKGNSETEQSVSPPLPKFGEAPLVGHRDGVNCDANGYHFGPRSCVFSNYVSFALFKLLKILKLATALPLLREGHLTNQFL